MPASSGSRESPEVRNAVLKRRSTRPSAASASSQPICRSEIAPLRLRHVAPEDALEQHVDLVVDRDPDRDRPPDDGGVAQHHVAQLVAGPGADQRRELLAVLAALGLREALLERGANERGVVGVDQGLLFQDLGVEEHVQADLVLPEGRVPAD